VNFAGALTYLFTTLLDLFIAGVMLRLLLQWVRADFYNPVSQFLVRVTNPALIPLRRIIPSIGKLDTASVVLMLILESAGVWIATRAGGLSMSLVQILVFSIIKLFMTLLWTYFILVIIRVVLSWVGAQARHPAIPLLFQLTEPVLAPFRKVIPPIAGFDLSPLFALIAIRFLMLLLGWR